MPSSAYVAGAGATPAVAAGPVRRILAPLLSFGRLA